VTLCATASVPQLLGRDETFPAGPSPVFLPLLDIVDATALYDTKQGLKNPDWLFDQIDSGMFPAERLQGQPVATEL
jgi:hypothetical protein